MSAPWESRVPPWVASALVRGALFLVGWWVVAEGRGTGGVLLPVGVAAALTLSLRLAPPGSLALSPPRLLLFIPWFLLESLRGGIDVAWRALHPRLPLDPGVVTHRVRLEGNAARVFFTNATSLLPGTLSLRLEGERLVVQALDVGADPEIKLEALERRVGRVFGEKWTD